MYQNNTKNRENDIEDIDELIQKIVNERRIIRRNNLILEIKDRVGVGVDTINRHIRKGLKQKLIVRIKYPDYKKYGISQEDKKAVYFVSSAGTEQVDYNDTIIEALASKDPRIRKNAMIEIESIQEVPLLPDQLTNLSNSLKTEDKTNCYQISRVIWDHFQKLIFPSDIRRFEDNLIYCFEKFRRTGNDTETNEGNVYERSELNSKEAAEQENAESDAEGSESGGESEPSE